MSVQKAIFPGLLIGIVCVIGFASLLLSHPAKGGINQTGSVKAEQVLKNGQNDAQSTSNGCSISPAYPQSIQQWCTLIDRYARENGISPNLVSAVMMLESAGHADAYSKSGAVGLLQVMPSDGLASSFMCPSGPCFADRPTTEQLYDPEFNISYGTKLLADLLQHYGDLRDALKAYGPKDVGYYYADLVLGILNTHQ